MYITCKYGTLLRFLLLLVSFTALTPLTVTRKSLIFRFSIYFSLFTEFISFIGHHYSPPIHQGFSHRFVSVGFPCLGIYRDLYQYLPYIRYIVSVTALTFYPEFRCSISGLNIRHYGM